MDMPLPLKFAETEPVQDRFQRNLQELRVSVIDRCNFRCTYCMPSDSLQGRGVFLPLEKLLTDHEIEDLVRAFVGMGVRKLRLTGGEPLIRPGLPALVEQLAGIDRQLLGDISRNRESEMARRSALKSGLGGQIANVGLGLAGSAVEAIQTQAEIAGLRGIASANQSAGRSEIMANLAGQVFSPGNIQRAGNFFSPPSAQASLPTSSMTIPSINMDF